MMHPTPFLLRAACVAALALGLAPLQAQTAAPERAGTVKLVQGQALAVSPQGERALQPGDAVYAQDRLQTGPASAASVVLRDGSTLMLGAASRVEVQSYSFDSTTHAGSFVASVLQGTLRMISGLIGKNKPDAVRVITPTSTIGLLGTDFIVDVEGVQP